ncbi:hypothetical protein LQW54_000258 [Pestalotiopsis sp. IQ-011]
MTTPTRTWLITGCSSGFGELFVRQLRASGENVIATGRNAASRLTLLTETGASILDLDVSAPPDVIDAKVAEAWEIYPGGIDVVVNNAGYYELALHAPGVKVLIVEPGCFRTRAFANINHVPARSEAYAQFNAAVRSVEAGIVGNEPGDAGKAVEIMIDLVRGNGVAAGREVSAARAARDGRVVED